MALSAPPVRQAGISELRVRGFRSVHDATLHPGAICALVGEANAGKSNLLAAIRALLNPSSPALTAADATIGRTGAVRIEAQLAGDGGLVWLEAVPPGAGSASREGAPPLVYVASELRASSVAAPAEHPAARRAAALLQRGLDYGTAALQPSRP